MPPLSPLQPVQRRRPRRYLLRRAVAVLALALAAAGAYALVSRLTSTNRHGARVIRFTIESRYVHQALSEAAVLPPGSDGRGRPLLVFLHGKGEDESSWLTSPMFAALAAQGARAPDVVFPNGSDDSYWHNRSSGAWATYVVREVIPRALSLTGADRRRIAIGGISMGGFGALDIARVQRGRFCAVGAHSAALWLRGADTATGAFDDAADFIRHDLIRFASSSNPYGRVPVWMDVGTSDPFAAADARLAHELRARGTRVTYSTSAGGHDEAYWSGHWGAYMGFYAKALSRCHGT